MNVRKAIRMLAYVYQFSLFLPGKHAEPLKTGSIHSSTKAEN